MTTESDRLETQHEARERDRWEAELSRNEPRAELMLSQAFVFRVYKRDADMILRALRGTLSEHEIAPARELSDRLTALRAQAVEQVAVGARIAVQHMGEARTRDGLPPDPLSVPKADKRAAAKTGEVPRDEHGREGVRISPAAVLYRPKNQYRGFSITYAPSAPITGRWQAARNGVTLCADSREALCRMIDLREGVTQ